MELTLFYIRTAYLRLPQFDDEKVSIDNDYNYRSSKAACPGKFYKAG